MAVVADRKTKLTYEDYLQFPEDESRHEIIDGDHYVSAAPFVPHQRILKRLMVQLYRKFEETGLGEVLPAPVAVVLSRTDVVEPDLVVVPDEHASMIRRERIEGAPDLVVEILSPSTAYRDRGLKLDLYRKSGVGEYWIVDPGASRGPAVRAGGRGVSKHRRARRPHYRGLHCRADRRATRDRVDRGLVAQAETPSPTPSRRKDCPATLEEAHTEPELHDEAPCSTGSSRGLRRVVARRGPRPGRFILNCEPSAGVDGD